MGEMTSEKLTAVKVKNARAPGLINDGKRLYLNIANGGTRSWIFRYTLRGKAHEMGLGSFDDFSLAEARDLAREQRRLCKAGLDPLEARRAKRIALRLEQAKEMTFRQCAEAYIAAHRADWRNAKHAAQSSSSLTAYVYPTLGELPVQAVDTALVTRVLESIWATKPETASRVRGRIESILGSATARGYRQGDNHARRRGHLKELFPPNA
jgi:hypothetical protein